MKRLISAILLLNIGILTWSQQFKPNYDESMVPSYTLPDPLVFNDGSRVTAKADWAKRRDEIFRLFENEVYGFSPAWKGTMKSTELSSDVNALGGIATRREVNLTLINGNREINFSLLVYLPHSPGPVPVFLGCNFGGNHSITDEPGIRITSSWMRNDPEDGVTNNRASEAGRGKSASRWPVREIISRGYGLVTLY
jgi:hypothetical protein